MRITKVKNLLVITNYENKTNSIDINTGTILGKKGTKVKNLSPDIKSYLHQEVYRNDNHQYTDYINAFFEHPECVDLLKFVDKMNALGLKVRRYDMQEFRRRLTQLNAIKYDKKLVTYLKTKNDGIVNLEMINKFQKYAFLSEQEFMLFSQINLDSVGLTIETQDEIKKIVEWVQYLLDHEYLSMLNDYTSVFNLIRDYIRKGKAIEKEELYTKNFLLNWCRVAKEYKLQENKVINKQIKEKQENRKLEFANDKFTILVPLTYEELKDESDQQNNCIARSYTDYIISGRTNIVFLRLNDSIDKSFLSLEVRNNEIRQALRKHNNSHTYEDKILLKQYQDYLNTITT